MQSKRRTLGIFLAVVPVVVLAVAVQRLARRIPHVVLVQQNILGIKVSPDGNLLLFRNDFSPSRLEQNSASPQVGFFTYNMAEGRIEDVCKVRDDFSGLWLPGRGIILNALVKNGVEIANRIEGANDRATLILCATPVKTAEAKVWAKHVLCDAGVAKLASVSWYPGTFCQGFMPPLGTSAGGQRIRVVTGPIMSEFDAATGKFLRDVRMWPAPCKDASLLAFAPDGRFLIRKGTQPVEISFDERDHPQIKSLPTVEKLASANDRAAFSPDGKLIFLETGGSSKRFDVYDAQKWRRLWGESAESARGFSSTGREFYSHDSANSILNIRDARTGQVLRQLHGFKSGQTAVAPNGSCIYEARPDRVLRWSLQ